MKKIIALIGVAVLALATVSTVQAQVPGLNTTTLSLPTSLQAGTTNYPAATAPYIDVSRGHTFTFSSTIWGNGTIGATNLYYLAPTADGVTFSTNANQLRLATNTVSAASTTNTCVMDFNCGDAIGYRLLTIVTTGVVTNGPHTAQQKISAP